MGTSNSKQAVAFRRCFFKLSELRSLVPKTAAFMALTATASKKTRATIISVLRLRDFVDVSHSPNKPNIAFFVHYMNKQMSLLDHFKWLLQNLRENKGSTDRVIIYCQTIKQCSSLYSLFVGQLGDSLFNNGDQRMRLVEMLHSLSSKETREAVLESMSREDGHIRVLICTIAFGMGVNCKGVSTVIHFGPSKTVEAYIQESGRAGRDGRPSKAILLYQSILLIHVEKAMKDYVKGNYSCRRQYLMGYFQDAGVTASGVPCCDLCTKELDFFFPVTPSVALHEGRTRCVSPEKTGSLEKQLVMFRKSVLLTLLSHAPRGKLPIVTVPELIIGFSCTQIKQVLQNADKLFTLSDVKKHVEIWREAHACAILKIIADIFGDIDVEELRDCDMTEDMDEDDDEWIHFVADEELLHHTLLEDLSFDPDNSFFHSSLDVTCSQSSDARGDVPEMSEMVSGLIDSIQIE